MNWRVSWLLACWLPLLAEAAQVDPGKDPVPSVMWAFYHKQILGDAPFVFDDRVKLPGSGLVAFGSIAFADSSETSSALIVPKVLLGLRDGRAWTRLRPEIRSLPANGAAKDAASPER